ncbi:MAG TPA: ABC transporter substrate-binding protein [Trueperaceae bacterium]|nr:ABC transporter substrate-binding protein [Trueperaceae bacterium]
MKRTLLFVVAATLLAAASAQVETFTWPKDYAPTFKQGGTVNETTFGDITTLNPVLTSSADEDALISLYAGPGTVYRDWLGNRSFQQADGSYNLYWAKDIKVLEPDQQWIVTLKQGWKWSDGVEMTTADVQATWTIIGDPKVESNNYACSVVGDQKAKLDILGKYQYEVTLPKPHVNAIAVNDCTNDGLIPAHIFMPVYKAKGAAGIKALWGVDTAPSKIVSGGPYILKEFRPGERVVLAKNPEYGSFVKAADGTGEPGPDQWVATLTQDQNQVLSRVVTGQSDFYWPTTLDQVKAVKDAIDKGDIHGTLYANIGPATAIDFITYNFNNTDKCKADMFRNVDFRRAVSMMIDRQALVNAAEGGLGYPAYDWNSTAATKPFDAPNLGPMPHDPEQGVQLLHDIGFTQKDSDGVLMDPTTGCKVAFDLQYNSGNNRRGQEAQVIAQTLAPYGVKVNPREVSTQIWANSIVGTSADFNPAKGRTVNYDAQIWGLAGGDIDNPSFDNGLRPGSNLDAWNKSTKDLQAWEILMGQYSVEMNETLDLQKRVQIYDKRAELMRQWLPITPLITQAFSFYTDLGNTWPKPALDAVSIQGPYRPGSFRELLTAR